MFDRLSELEVLIINVLATQYPLSSKDILEKIDKRKMTRYSKSGLQRALKLLLGKGMLSKYSKYYQLSTDTLINEKKRIQSVLDRYIEAQNFHIFQKQESNYYFETLSELDYFWNAVIEQWFNFYPKKKYEYLQKQPLPWFAIMHLDEERRVIKRICEDCKAFKTYSFDTKATQQLKSVYREHNISKFILSKSVKDLSHSFALFGDHVIETIHPPKITQIIKKLCMQNSDSILVSSIIEMSAKGNYKLSISKDRQKVEKYRKLLNDLDG
jgi:predicted transcriptional regulator